MHLVSLEMCPPHHSWLGLRGDFPMTLLVALNLSHRFCGQ